MPVELIALTLFALSQIGAPGPANMALLATGAGYGLRRALPFVAGVVVGKQLIIWPLGFGLMQLAQSAPGVFLAGLIVHPVNPKAWGMITAAFTSFVAPGATALTATAGIAVVLLLCQTLLHPMWAGAGQLIAATIQGTRAERFVFILLSILTVGTVFYALFGSGTAP